MDALLMCGGAGTRLDAEGEKPLFEVDGRPMVDRVLDALADSRIERTTAVTSPVSPRTREHLEDVAATRPDDIAATDGSRTAMDDLAILDAPGEGYVADLQYALERTEPPVLTVVADLPLLEGAVIDRVLDRYDECDAGTSLTVCVPAALKRTLGATVDAMLADEDRTLAPTGVNVVGAAGGAEGDRTTVFRDARLAVNVNRRTDADVAAALLDSNGPANEWEDLA